MKAPLAAAVLGAALALAGIPAFAQSAHWDSGVSHYNQKQYRQAIVEFQKVVDTSPEFANTYYYLGMSHFMLKEYSKAIGDLGRYVTRTDQARKNPEPVAVTALGTAFYLTQDYQKAAEILSRAVQLDPTKASNYYYLGAAYQQLKQRDKAVEALSQGVRMSPTSAPERTNMLAMLTQMLLQKAIQTKTPADFQAAIQRAEQLLVARPNADSHALLGDIYNAAGDYTKASVHYAKAAPERQNDGAFWYSYGVALLQSKQLPKAETAFLKASELLPNNAAVWNALGYLQEVNKQYDKALVSYEKAYAIQPDPSIKESIDRVKTP